MSTSSTDSAEQPDPARTARLAAGEILPDTELARDDGDILWARRYRHPAVEDRAVVRLVPQTLGQAEDLTCEFLGFAAPERTEPVGTAKRSALGFPAWALVNDPANGHHALNLVKDIERLARTAKSRAGAAKEGFVRLATMLGRTAPHFLPTFYEQAGRIFLEHGNDTYAASMFGKAREAEEVHALATDSDRLREVFLEFAFAEALTAKALSAYSKRLAQQQDPAAGYELFFSLCVERTNGGLPPYADMAADLRRLAKAAHRDIAAEEERLLSAVLDSTAITHAPMSFWKAYRTPLVTLARQDDAIRIRLLSFVPSEGFDNAAVEMWIDLLRRAGALRLLTEATEFGAARVTPAAWLSSVIAARVAYHSSEGPRSAALLDVAATMIDRLKTDGEPVRELTKWPYPDWDLLDLLLANDVPIADDGQYITFPVGWWLADNAPGRRDLAAIAGAQRFLDALVDGIRSYVRLDTDGILISPQTLSKVMSIPGLRIALAHWITTATAKLHEPGLPDLAERWQKTFQILARPEAFVDIPEAANTLASVDVTAALHGALRNGLFDELGWPALEAGVERLSGPGWSEDDEPVLCGEGWPALVLRRGETFVVVGPDGILAEHLSRIPAGSRHGWGFHPRAHWFDGVLLVVWQTHDGHAAYWSDAPADIITLTDEELFDSYWRTPPASIALADGARFMGGRAIRPGDTAISTSEPVAGDGSTVWTAVRSDQQWWEVDPATGERSRLGSPRFFTDFAADRHRLMSQDCALRPSVPATVDSPLGESGGLHGWRVRADADGTWLGEGIDGRQVRLSMDHGVPEGLLRLPGGAELVLTTRVSGADLALLDRDGQLHSTLVEGITRGHDAAGTPFVPPKEWLHVLRPRDEAGSLALRQVDRETVEKMVTAVATAMEEHDRLVEDHRAGGRELTDAEKNGVARAIENTVVTELPALTHPALRLGVGGRLRQAASLSRSFRSFGEIVEKLRSGVELELHSPENPPVSHRDIDEALHWMRGRDEHGHHRDPHPTVLPAFISRIGELAAQPATSEVTLSCDQTTEWFDWFPYLAAVAHRTVAGFATEDEQRALLVLLKSFADSGTVDNDGRWRSVTLVSPHRDHDEYRVIAVQDGFLLPVRLSRYTDPTEVAAIQFTRTPGVFAIPSGWQEQSAVELRGPFGTANLHRLLTAFAERGPAPWFPESAAALSDRTGLSIAEATLFLAGLPGIFHWRTSFLDSALRKRLGLSASEADSARQRWLGLAEDLRRGLLAAAVPADPERLWTHGPDVDAIAELWVAEFGRRKPVPDDLLIAATKRLPLENVGTYLGAIANVLDTPWLQGCVGSPPDPERCEVFGVDALRAMPQVLRWSAYELPVDAPLRKQLPLALAASRMQIDHAHFGLVLTAWAYPEELTPLLGHVVDEDLGEGIATHPYPWLQLTGLRGKSELTVYPAVVPPHDAELFAAVVHTFDSRELLDDLDALRSDLLSDVCTATAPAGTPSGAYFHNPLVSAPELITEVGTRFGLDADASVLYLQLLALPDPTDANVARWTGWTPARLRKARAALAETDLVMTAKRPKAGRSLFVPGGWLIPGGKDLPLERWKTPLFDFDAEADADQAILPAGTIADLFARAWRRVLDGDIPTYQELETGGRR